MASIAVIAQPSDFKNRCFGCDWINKELRKRRESHKGCLFWECAQNKSIECCFQCKEFPCKTHYDPKEAVYTKQVLDMWKELEEKEFTLEKRRKPPN